MNRLAILLALPVLAAGGCHYERYRSQPLGAVDYTEAFRTARSVFGQHFSVAAADPDAGTIVARPQAVPAARDRLLGTSPARKVGKMLIRRSGDQVVADIRIDIQRQDVGATRHMQPVTADTELPHQTPAQETGPLSAAQDQAWETTGRDEALEVAILRAILTRLSKKE